MHANNLFKVKVSNPGSIYGLFPCNKVGHL